MNTGVRLTRLSVQNFRNLIATEIDFPDSGTTLIQGRNGQGKSNFLEAIGLVCWSRSFRGASADALVRIGETSAFLRGSAFNDDRELLIEMELAPGRSRTLVNKQRQSRSRALDISIPITSFSPADLDFVKGSPQVRRDLIDHLQASVSERFRVTELDFERALKQRNSLLKQCRGRLDSDAGLTLDIWDQRLGDSGNVIAESRQKLVSEITPFVEQIYRRISGSPDQLQMIMKSNWMSEGGLVEALANSRKDDLRRETTTVGPHRDDVEILLNGMPSRTHSSQGEQRSIAVATKLAAHKYCAEHWKTSPILLLDDVFSELDDERVARFLDELPQGQVFIASAAGHSLVQPDALFTIDSGKVML